MRDIKDKILEKDQTAIDHERSLLSDLKQKEMTKQELEEKIRKLSETISERSIKIDYLEKVRKDNEN